MAFGFFIINSKIIGSVLSLTLLTFVSNKYVITINKNLLTVKQKVNKKNNYKNLTLTGNDQMTVAESIVIYITIHAYIYICIHMTHKYKTEG